MLNVQLLRALCQLSLDEPERSSLGFTSRDLVLAMSRERGRAWSDHSDKEQMSDDIRGQWNKLLKTWQTKGEGLAQQLSDAHFSRIPELNKTEGGGTGNPTLYRIDWISPAARPLALEISEASEPSIGQVKILRYVCEDIEEVNPLARIFSRGFQLKGWRRRLYILTLVLPLLLVWLLLVGVTMSLTVGGKSALTSLLSLAVIFGAVMLTIGPMFRLGGDRIVIAPWWMQSVDGDRLLERRAPPRHDDNVIKAVRYVAKCPLCGGTVLAIKGRLEFFGRIVGRCEEAPVEHVFSFDHITRHGRWLR